MSPVILLLHGTYIDEFIELGLPLLIFGVLYWWSVRKEKNKKKNKKKEAVRHELPDQPPRA